MAGNEKNEKREHPRRPTCVEVEVVSGGRVAKAKAKDVSQGGMFIDRKNTTSYEVDEDIVLAFESKTGDAHALDAKIIRKSDKGIGVQFKKTLVDKELEDAQEWD